MDVSGFRRDSAAIEAGKWVDDIPEAGDLRLRVRGLNSATVVALRARKERVLSRKDRDRTGAIKPDVAMRIFAEVLHEAVLLEWDCLFDGKTPIPYSPETAKEFLTNPNMIGFANAVTTAAGIVDRETTSDTEDVAKNSSRPSGGKSSGAPGQTA